MERELKTAFGIPVYYDPNPKLHGFCLCLYVKAGPLYEADEQNGSTHYFEHMVFRHLQNRLNGELYRLLDRLGLEFSACTYRELLQFKIVGAAQHFDKAADILSQILSPMCLSAADVAMERRRIKAEIREDGERRSLDYFARQLTWAGTPLRNPITGRPAVLDRLGPAAVEQLRRTLLTTPNLFFYATGHVSETHMRRLIGYADRFPITSGPVNDNRAPVPADFGKRNGQVAVKNGDAHLIRFSFDVDVSRYQNAELDLLYDILFTGDSCKLYQALSEQTGYAYSYDACFEKYRNIGCLYLQYETRSADLLPSIQAAAKAFSALKSDLDDELELVRAAYVDNAGLLLDDCEEYNWIRAYEGHVLGLPYRDWEERAAAYAAVTPARITAICRELFVPDRLVLTIKTDRRRVREAAIREIIHQI